MECEVKRTRYVRTSEFCLSAVADEGSLATYIWLGNCGDVLLILETESDGLHYSSVKNLGRWWSLSLVDQRDRDQVLLPWR